MSRRKKAPVEREWLVSVKVTFDGAVAFVDAASEDEARVKAEGGFWNDIDTLTASMTDCRVRGVKPNE